jgi:predicted negative regulator of RcsB-dependent stress response
VRGDALYAKGERAAALAEYQAARAGDTDGVLDAALLDLKIADLVADGVAPAPETADKPAAKPAG